MSHLPIIAASFLAGSGPDAVGATQPWFVLTELERIVYAFSSLRDEENEDFGSGQSQPTNEQLGLFWAGEVDGDAALAAGAVAETNAFQLSGPAVSGAFWSLGDVTLGMDATGPLIQAFTGGASRMSFEVEVLVPTRVSTFIHLVTDGTADSLSWVRLVAGVDEGAPSIYDLEIDKGEVLVEEELTLAAGRYLLEAGSRTEVFDVMGQTTARAGFGLSFTPTSACNAADLALPVGELNIDDVLVFLGAFANQENAADLDTPLFVYDISDVIKFLTLFGEGCP